MDNKYTIRLISESDVHAVLAIYKPYVLHTAITFEYEVPTVDEYAQRIKTNTADYPWLVCLNGDEIVGYAYASTHRYRTAYQWSPESTIYIAAPFHRNGIARVLYETLFSLLRLQGYVNVYAGVSLPNPKSIGFHHALGFEDIGIFKKVGYKLGNWHDTHWLQLHLSEHILNPPAPKVMREIMTSEAFQSILASANSSLEIIKS